jgi:hypothetical protein
MVVIVLMGKGCDFVQITNRSFVEEALQNLHDTDADFLGLILAK